MSWRRLVVLLLLCHASLAAAAVEVTDFLGRSVHLQQPAERIVALAPHIVENLFTAGVGERLVGAVSNSDYPPAAKKIPRVGRYTNVSMEAIVALAPDLVITWASNPGMSRARLRQFQRLGIPVYVSSPQTLTDIARAIVDYGILAGRADYARRAAAQFRRHLSALRERYADRKPVSVFYQVWNDPLTTLNGSQFVGAVIRLCGGRNIFAQADAVAPQVSLEAVLARDPAAIVAGGRGDKRPPWLAEWRQWPALQAVQAGHLFYIPADLLHRPTVRILQGARRLCRQLQSVRADQAHS